MARSKYNRRKEDYEDKDNFLALHKDVGIPIRIDKAGKIYAKGFVDTNDNIEFSHENDKLLCNFPDDVGPYKQTYEIQSVPVFKYVTMVYDQIYAGFQNFVNPSHMYTTTDANNYKFLSKHTKGLISTATSNQSIPRSFHYNYFTKDGHRYVNPEIESTWLGPFNYDVYVEPYQEIKNTRDLTVIKSGEYWVVADDDNQEFGIRDVLYSTGISGHVYVQTMSVPEHNYGANNLDVDQKMFKFPRSGNSHLKQASPPMALDTGDIGLFKNGVLLHSPLNNQSYSGLGVWNENSFVSRHHELDGCLGGPQEDVGVENYLYYNYKSWTYCIDEINTGQHSPLLGYAKDGFPIYGPVGYSGANDPSSPTRILDTSYKLKQASSRANGPYFTQADDYGTIYTSGYFIEDYEYVNGLGDLDEHNGRSCTTPEYPGGTYAYFSSVDDDYYPKYPYVIGPTYYGEIEESDGIDGEITEPIELGRFRPISDSWLYHVYPNPQVNVWDVWGDTHTVNKGLKSEKIIYVSPHIVNETDGVFLKTGYHQYLRDTGVWDYALNTGSGMATHYGNKLMATGNGLFMTENSGFRYPTSESMIMYDGIPLSGGVYFSYFDMDTSSTLPGYSPASITGTYLYSAYSGHKLLSGRVDSRPWNGRIPAGTPFKIETWAFNGFEMGFDGKYQITPCEAHPLTSGNLISVATEVTGVGWDEEEAYTNAMGLARHNLKKQLNTFLVKNGIKNENSKMRAWRKLKHNQTQKSA